MRGSPLSVVETEATVDAGPPFAAGYLSQLVNAFALIYHLYLHRLPGVYLLFLLSGYLLVLALCKEHFSISNYFWNLVARHLPLLLVVLIAYMALGLVQLSLSEYIQLARHSFESLLFAKNLPLESELGYFDKEIQLKPIANLWSLSVERQFTLLSTF